jgi:DNA-binding MarR family transcriptional regulator
MVESVAHQHERLAHVIKEAFRCTSGRLQQRLKAHHVLYGHWTLLRVLWQTDGLTQRQLSQQAGLKEPSTHAALLAMEQQGYIQRLRLPDNKKQIRVFVTAKGKSLKNAIVAEAEGVNALATQGVSAEDLAATRRTLLSVIRNLGPGVADEDMVT